MDHIGVGLQNRYPIKNGKVTIELKLKTPSQLFDERDPSPFRERDLDDDAVRYIVSSLREISTPEQARLALYFASLGDSGLSPQTIRNAIHAHFAYEADLKQRELRYTFQVGFKSLAIGLTCLMACTTFSHSIYSEVNSSLLMSLIKEGLFIMGWVSMWKPISIFLHEWWPIKASQKLLEQLALIEIDIKPLEEAINETAESGRVAAGAALRVPGLRTS